jgi:methionyl-tRNA synthetase
MITIDDFKKKEIRVGKILAAEPLAGSLKLLKLAVSFGELGQRQIIAGIAPYYTELSALVGKKVAFAYNLEPRTLLGEESQGMVLGVGEEESFSLLSADDRVSEGSIVR